MSKLEQYQNEVDIRKRNLEIKRQVQAAENNKELELLMLMDTMLDGLKIEREKELNTK